MKFYATEWLQDTRELSPATRGIWLDILCVLSLSEPRGILSLTPEIWARKLSITLAEFDAALAELEAHRKPNFLHDNNGKITLESRRLIKERKYYESLTERQKRYHDKKKQHNAEYNANITHEVTPQTLDFRLQTSDFRQHTHQGDGVWNSLSSFNTLAQYYPNRVGKTRAQKLFQKYAVNEIEANKIANALANYLQSASVKRGYIRNFDTWMESWQEWENYTEEKND